MTSIRYLLAGIAVASVLTTACSSNDREHARTSSAQNSAHQSNPLPASAPTVTTSPTPHSDGVRRITATDLKAAIDKGDVVVIDVRGEAAYKAGHIKGAIMIPVADVEKRYGEIPRGKLIVTYCS
jgi:3-mercaptopyruvate sulfurtransferase SseA